MIYSFRTSVVYTLLVVIISIFSEIEAAPNKERILDKSDFFGASGIPILFGLFGEMTGQFLEYVAS
ncbi:unnamed protein product [Heterobilharzia americana]|nr:unnamed protein product [Heterobilharzia americana]